MTQLVSPETLHRPRTSEERQQAAEALAQADRIREELLAQRGGKLFPRAEDDLDGLRDERTGQLP